MCHAETFETSSLCFSSLLYNMVVLGLHKSSVASISTRTLAFLHKSPSSKVAFCKSGAAFVSPLTFAIFRAVWSIRVGLLQRRDVRLSLGVQFYPLPFVHHAPRALAGGRSLNRELYAMNGTHVFVLLSAYPSRTEIRLRWAQMSDDHKEMNLGHVVWSRR